MNLMKENPPKGKKLYQLDVIGWLHDFTIGIYASREKAEAMASECPETFWDGHVVTGFKIQEFELDSEPDLSQKCREWVRNRLESLWTEVY